VLAELPRDMATDVVMRMLRMETVQKEVIQEVEQTLKGEFMTNLSRSQRRDPHEAMAELFNALDRSTEEAMLTALDERAPETAERIRALMFTFEDLGNLTPGAIQTLVSNCDKRELALALKGAPEDMKHLFLSGMTERAAKLMRADMDAMGPVRARACDEAQAALVRLAKDLGDRGEIMLVDPKSDDAMIY
jgi:flagellar motor switch protein FliG